MSFPERCRSFPKKVDGRFAGLVADVLRRSLGERSSSIKIVAGWTGAGERTVKNWFAGQHAPCGDHFLELVRHCPDMLDEFLAAAGQPERLAGVHLRAARLALVNSLLALDKVIAEAAETASAHLG